MSINDGYPLQNHGYSPQTDCKLAVFCSSEKPFAGPDETGCWPLLCGSWQPVPKHPTGQVIYGEAMEAACQAKSCRNAGAGQGLGSGQGLARGGLAILRSPRAPEGELPMGGSMLVSSRLIKSRGGWVSTQREKRKRERGRDRAFEHCEDDVMTADSVMMVMRGRMVAITMRG